jgi:hypothetical protein
MTKKHKARTGRVIDASKHNLTYQTARLPVMRQFSVEYRVAFNATVECTWHPARPPIELAFDAKFCKAHQRLKNEALQAALAKLNAALVTPELANIDPVSLSGYASQKKIRRSK